VGAIHPACDADRRWSDVAIGDAYEREAGKALVKDYADLLLDPFICEPAQDMARAPAMPVVHAIAALVAKGKAIDARAVRKPQRLARLEDR